MRVPFTKMHGLGNDFIVIPWLPSEPLPPHAVSQLCDRHFGIGADGVLLLSPTPNADVQMIVLNADGSRPEMCGNGLRCAALHTMSRLHPRAPSAAVRILTDAGILSCFVEAVAPDSANVTAEVGTYSPPKRQTLHVGGAPIDLHVLSVGNPHAICFTDDIHSTFDAFGPAVANHPAFPNGINATLATRSGPNALHLRVWERGVGPTLACATAACATAAAAVHTGLIAPDQPITAHLPGGPLTVQVDPTTATLRMRGPAVSVFDGSFPLPPGCQPSTPDFLANP
jgi:diaminopimelate epimerase